MDPYQVLLLILVLVAFFYLALVFYVVGKMREFRLRLKGKLRGLNLLLYERTEALKYIVTLFQTNDIPMTSAVAEAFEALGKLDFTHVKEEEVRLAMDVVKTATSQVRYLAQSSKEIQADPRYQQFTELLDDLERSFRTLTSQYNADVVAHNYWIKIPTVSWFGYIIGYRKRTLIN